MTLDLLRAHPDLVAEFAPDATRHCPVPVRHGGATWQCSQPARWRVRGYLAQCGIHAARTLRQELKDRLDAKDES